jgi:hypothetical protein
LRPYSGNIHIGDIAVIFQVVQGFKRLIERPRPLQDGQIKDDSQGRDREQIIGRIDSVDEPGNG